MIRLYVILTLTLFGFLSYQSYYWQSPEINLNFTLNIHDSIYKNKPLKKTITSMKNKFFVAFIEHSPEESINPYFPSIHIHLTNGCDGWLHLVRTDSIDNDLKIFIDSTKESPSYPFYTLGNNFYDAPIWYYTLFSKPLSFWKGHAYAVKIDKHKKTVECQGGISWGFTLSSSHIRPQIITPEKLEISEWKTDWNIFQKELPEYVSIS